VSSGRLRLRRNIHKRRETTEYSREQETKHSEVRCEHAGIMEQL
jgi:hypothetical protein